MKFVVNMKFMDGLPTVISCCFCCFLRAGTVMIGIFSFMTGLIFAPNVSNTKGFWDLRMVLMNYSSATETIIQVIIGIMSIVLCIVSFFLIIGSCCNIPLMIEVYQWGALVYCVSMSIMYLILAFMCFFIHTNCFLAGGLLCVLIGLNILLTAYFVIVANSLRLSLRYLTTSNALNLV